MGDYYCDTCDKKMELKMKNQHLKTKSHKGLSMNVVKRCCVKNPKLFEIENILH